MVINGSKNRKASGNLCNFIKDSFICNTVRGDDSTGVMQLDANKGMYLYKEPVAGGNFVKTQRAQRFINDSDTAILTVGHNRAATAGVVSQENAHPFTHTTATRTVTGVHNGTLLDWGRTTEGKDFKVDSDWAMKTLAREGSVDAFEYFKGAFCFVWYDDSTPNVLNIARNDQRPMFFAYVKNKDIMVASSEPGMLSWLTARNNIDIEGIIYQTDVDTHYRFDLDNPRNFTKEALVKVDHKHFHWNFTKGSSASASIIDDEYDWVYGSNNSRDNGWGEYGRHWSGSRMSGIDQQANFMYKMFQLLSPKAEKKKETVIALTHTPDVGEVEDVIKQASEFSLGEMENGVYASEKDLAVGLSVKDKEIWVGPVSYDITTRSAYMEYLGTDDLSLEDDTFKAASMYVIRDIDESIFKTLERSNLVKVAVQGAYFLLPNEEDLVMIVDSSLIKMCRKSSKMPLRLIG